MFGAKNLLPCLATNYFQLPPYHSQFYHHIQVYHPLPNSTTSYHHIPFYHLPPFCYKNHHTTIPFPIIPPYPSLPFTAFLLQKKLPYYIIIPNSTNYHQFYYLLECCYKLLPSTTKSFLILPSTTYCYR